MLEYWQKRMEKRDVYYLKGLHKRMFSSIYNRKDELTKGGYIILPYNGMEIISLPAEKPFKEFITDGVTSYNGMTFVKNEQLKFDTAVWENNPI